MSKIEIEKEEYDRLLNNAQDYINTYVEGFVSNIFSHGIINEVEAKTLRTYFSNPDEYTEEIEKLAHYYYISSAETHQLFELIEALPTLNYKIDSYDKPKDNDKNISLINKTLAQVKHRRLTRDILKQTASSGTTVGIWLGDKKNIYPFIFESTNFAFPAYRGSNGDWVCHLDLSYFKDYKDHYRKILLNNFSPFITERNYNDFLEKGDTHRYVELPQDRTFVHRTGTLKRNQRLGTSWVTSGMYDVLHKKKLKDVEQSIANKVINAVAVLTIGHISGGKREENPYSNLNLNTNIKKKVHSGVKNALEKNTQSSINVVALPDFAKLDFPTVDTDGLGGKKFDHINNDISAAYGISNALFNGQGDSQGGAKINLEVLYKRIGVMLEECEEMYRKMINLIVPKSQKDNYFIVYDKETPLTLKEKTDILVKLNDKGWSIKHIIDNLSGMNWDSYLLDTLYETETLKLQERIRPYLQSSTLSSSDVSTLIKETEEETDSVDIQE